MFPIPPYESFTWHLTQHMGRVSPVVLYQFLWAASEFSGYRDPAQEINNYIVANKVVPRNVRADSGQPDVWRDYQQILSELGLIYSTEVRSPIELTPLGLAYIDGAVGYSDVITLQLLRYQFPNGHKLMIQAGVRDLLPGALAGAGNLAELQAVTGVQIRPAVLIWSVLRELERLGEDPWLSVDDLQCYLMRCSTHGETAACVAALVADRASGALLDRMPQGRRNAQDWMRFCHKSPLFAGESRPNACVRLSDYAEQNADEIDGICSTLRAPESFWMPATVDRDDRLSWYAHYGSVNLAIDLIPAEVGVDDEQEFPGGREQEEDEDEQVAAGSPAVIALRDFDAAALRAPEDTGAALAVAEVQVTYDVAISRNQQRRHDEMLIMIAEVCRSNGATVRDDPRSIDLLATISDLEFIIEVKSVTPRNLVRRLRYALGQVYHYDYLRAREATAAPRRRRVIALTAHVPGDYWCVPFLNEHMDVDLLTLDGRALRVDTRSTEARALFTAA